MTAIYQKQHHTSSQFVSGIAAQAHVWHSFRKIYVLLLDNPLRATANFGLCDAAFLFDFPPLHFLTIKSFH